MRLCGHTSSEERKQIWNRRFRSISVCIDINHKYVIRNMTKNRWNYFPSNHILMLIRLFIIGCVLLMQFIIALYLTVASCRVNKIQGSTRKLCINAHHILKKIYITVPLVVQYATLSINQWYKILQFPKSTKAIPCTWNRVDKGLFVCI